MKLKNFRFATLLIAASLLLHGCGGRHSYVSPSGIQGGGNGKVAATVKLTGRVGGRMAALSATATVNVTITISGVYSEDKKEFPPVSATYPINLAQGHASVSLVNVPTGVNHLLVAVAGWGSATETVKVIIPSVSLNTITTVTADAAGTVVADTAIYYAAQRGKALYEVPADTILGIQDTVKQMAANGIALSDMTPASVLAEMGKVNIPASISLAPATATVVTGGTLQFNAHVLDANGYPISAATTTWSFSEPTVGGISPAGLFTGAAAGAGIVTASYATLTATAPVYVISTCQDNTACNDNNPLTIDSCSNPGTLNAQCAHLAIACNVNADCNDDNPATLDTCAGGGAIGASCSHAPIANQPPAASASVSVSSGIAPLAVNFTGGCTDPDGMCAAYSWNFGDGSPTSSSQNPSHTFTATGTFTVTLTATDNQGATAQSTVTVTVAAANQPPTATAGASPTSGVTPLTVDFTGGCTDPDGTCIMYEWAFGDGATGSVQNASHTYNGAGTFNAALHVKDNQGATNVATVTITVTGNQPPAGTNTSDVATGAAPLTVNFSGTCTDSDGTCVSYLWDFGDGSPVSSLQNPSHTFTAAGSFPVTMTLTDNLGATTQGAMTIIVTAANQPPAVSASASPASGTVPLNVTFTGGCTDSDGTCVTYLWDFGDGGPNSALQNTMHSFNATGTFTVTLTATDNLGATAQSTTTVTVAAANLAPTVTISSDIATGTVPLAVNFTGTCTDSDGTCVSYSWDFGDGSPTVSAQNPNHTFNVGGILTVTLTVIDDRGATGQATKTISAMYQIQKGKISAGDSHTCVVTAGGGVKCWGNNSYGQLGDGTTTNRTTPVNVSGLASGIKAVTAGASSHTCALTTGGGVKCWGDNSFGQLGDGTNTNRTTPVDVSGLASGVNSIVAGQYHTCALTTAGGVKCWGNNASGQLGDGTNTTRTTPVNVSGLASNIIDIAAGYQHNCVLTFGGGVKCWGNNAYGQLGDGTASASDIPVDVSGLTSGFAMITAGSLYSCALRNSGSIMCWGFNDFGQFGDATLTQSLTPESSGGGDTFISVAGGTHSATTCAITIDGELMCWGRNDYGEVGNGTTSTNSPIPIYSSGLAPDILEVTEGAYYTCVITTGGTVKCWGNNGVGQLGDGTTTDRLTPVVVNMTPNIPPTASASSDVATGPSPLGVNFTGGCTDSDGACVSYSWNFGDGSATSTLQNPSHVYSATGTFTAVLMVTDNLGATGMATVSITIAANQPPSASVGSDVATGTAPLGVNFTGGCTDNDGTCVSYSWNFGDGSPTNSTQNPSHSFTATGTFTVTLTVTDDKGATAQSTTSITALPAPPTSFSIGNTHACVVLNGGAKCSGDNAYGEIGDNATATRLVYTDVLGLTSGVSQISASVAQTSCAITTGGGVKCWGSNGTGSVGDGTNINRYTPVDVTGLTSGVAKIDAGASHACALTTGGGVKCWGYNYYNELGDGTNVDKNVPVDVSGLTSGVTAISGRAWHVCALTIAGGVKCWGEGFSNVPTDVAGLTTGVVAVSAGYNSTCVIMNTGGVKCWGGNGSGQLGDGTNNTSATPVDVVGLTSGVAAISVGWRQACAITIAGAMKCWGENTVGQLGDGTTNNSNVPVNVSGMTSGVTAMFNGQASTCAVQNGVFKCWGQNGGLLGDGTTSTRLTPVIITP